MPNPPTPAPEGASAPESFADVIAEAHGYAQGHAEYMGDQAYYPNGDEHLMDILDRLVAARERERTREMTCDCYRESRAADEKTWAEKHTIVVGKYNEACAANERLEAERAERSAVLEAIAVEMEHEGPQAVMRFEWAKRIREAM